MSISLVKSIPSEENNHFYGLFGNHKVKMTNGQTDVSFMYGENTFYNACSQFIDGYQGDSFSFFRIAAVQEGKNKGVETEPTGFFLKPSDNSIVTITNHFGTTAQVTNTAAALVCWIITLGQVAGRVNDSDAVDKICRLMNDLTCLCYEFEIDGEPLFNQQDKDGIYQLIN